MDSRQPSDNRVALGFSGGADSTAAALILKERGFEVVAVTMLLPRAGEAPDALPGPAGAIADALGVEHLVLDVTGDFERLVVGPFVDAYLRGFTPNPCVTCNRDIKFPMLLIEALNLGCRYVATGHYARLSTAGDGARTLLRALDRDKDQSYVLWTLGQETLADVLFPLGESTRAQVERVVEDAGLSGSVLRPSQDICFLAGDSYRRFIERRMPGAARPGPIVDQEGRELGSHRGLPFYTVGQRRGLGLGGGDALYVLEIRPSENALVVGPAEELPTREFVVEQVHIISGPLPEGALEVEVMTRYRGPLLPARLQVGPGGGGRVRYHGDGPPAAPGQSAVFYLGEALIGGGIIARR